MEQRPNRGSTEAYERTTDGQQTAGHRRPTALAIAAGRAAEDLFVDRAAQWGLAFSYWNGMSGQLYYPEIIGGGVALFDADGDGDLDVFFPQGTLLGKGPPTQPPPVKAGGRLFRNELVTPTGRRAEPQFVDVTEASGIRTRGYGTGVATGDVDNDGDLDLLVLGYGSRELWRNRGDGTFEDGTRAAGVESSRFGLRQASPTSAGTAGSTSMSPTTSNLRSSRT